jgi:hypothetical protein
MKTHIDFTLSNGSDTEVLDIAPPRVGDEIFLSESTHHELFKDRNTYHKVVKVTLCLNKGHEPFYHVITEPKEYPKTST